MTRTDKPISDVVLKDPAPKLLDVGIAAWQRFIACLSMDNAPEIRVQPAENGVLEIFYILPSDARTARGDSVAGKRLLLLEVPQGGWVYKQ